MEFSSDLVPGIIPTFCGPYKMPQNVLKELNIQQQELHEKGFVRPSSSPWGCLVIFAKKKISNSQNMC